MNEPTKTTKADVLLDAVMCITRPGSGVPSLSEERIRRQKAERENGQLATLALILAILAASGWVCFFATLLSE